MREGSLEASETWLYTGDIHGYPRIGDHLPNKPIRKYMEDIEDRKLAPAVKVWPGNIFCGRDKTNYNMALAVKWLRMSYVLVQVIFPETEEERKAYKTAVGRDFVPGEDVTRGDFRDEEDRF
jgi:hypothetical protein